VLKIRSVAVSKNPVDWESVYRTAFPSLYRAVLATTLDAEIALDAVQDAFELGLRRPPPNQENVVGWLFRVAVRRSLRHRFRRPRVLAPEYIDEITQTLDRLEVGSLLRILTPRQRAIVVAHYFLGLRHAEIAALLGVKRGTVGATITHALSRMREEKAHV
jgi:RNA polymerase sigma factor (sigma-70 family)